MDEERDVIEVTATESEPEVQSEEPIGQDKAEREEQDFKFCSACGRKISASASFCDGCGKACNDFSHSGFERNDKYIPEKINDIVGKERAYYSEAFAKLKCNANGVCWNWYACLGWLWYAYRKMPVEAVIFYCLFKVAGAIPFFGGIVQIALLIANGAWGNRVYLKHIYRTIDKIDLLPSQVKLSAVKEYGGVSGLMLVVAFILSSVISGGADILYQLFGRTYSNLPRSFWSVFRY